MLGYSDMSTKPQRKPLTGVWMLVLALLLFALTLTTVAMLEAGRAQTQEDQANAGNVFLVSRLWTTHFRAATNETGDEIPATVERVARDATNVSHSNNYYEEQRAVVVNAESAPPILAERQDQFGPPQSRMDSYEADPIYEAADEYEVQQSSEERESVEQTPGEGRAVSQSRPFDSYYGQWQHDSKKLAPASAESSDPAYNYRKLPPASNRPPYPVYDDIYDYPMGFQPRPKDQAIPKQVVPTQASAVANVPVPTESTLVTVLKSLKQIWDLYQALTSAWNAVSERHQESSEQLKKERLEKQRLRQQQQQKLRVNSKKPPRIEGEKLTKKAKGTTTTTSTSTTTTTTESNASNEATAAPAKGTKGDDAQESSVRGLRQKREPESASTDVGEGRYIKGDPLKGYYDFVITEGSYKFWAAFQVGTAILIIYSTFAAIYYSKVNPLTSDYDYQDYLGASRSLSGADDDFVDDSDDTTTSTSSTSRIMDWIPRTAHSIKFIMDAIDKIPLDHDEKLEKGWSTGSSETATSAETTGEN
ncbi:pinin [Drosophila innubila]|uniref:pinin n=1 Tax=Drosophila innubila TaxID=198719 RepID=UPI00148BB0BD|nr:pinin [Drosophila innubila]